MTAADRLTSIPPMPPPPRAEGSSSSGLSIAIGGQFLAIVASVVVSAAFLVRTSGDGKIELKHGVGPIVWSLIPLWVVLLGSVLLNARRRTETLTKSVGLRVRWTDPLYAVLGPILQIIGASLYVPFHVDAKELEKPARDIVDQAGTIGIGFWVLAAALVVGAPIVEELFYRGLVLGALRRTFAGSRLSGRVATICAIVISGVWFGAIHLEPLQFPVLALVGIVCATVVVRTGRVIPSMFIHLGFNLVSVIELGWQLSRK